MLRHSASALLRHIPRRPHTAPLRKSSNRAAKLRPLIDLYHESDTYVTMENLSYTIDKEFTLNDYEENEDRSEKDLRQLRRTLSDRKALPRLVPADVHASTSYTTRGVLWSEVTDRRRAQVRAALFGVADRSFPGLEVVQDAQAERRKSK